jgi:NADH-quinone oxidoreductase subunit I
MAVTVKIIKDKTRESWIEQSYMIPVIKGLLLTFRHLFSKRLVIQYPEEKKVMPANYRGLHMLTRDEQGRPKCVACEMCSTACPADCIRIVAKDGGWPDSREKYPLKFEINELRCIFCGLCVEACPEDAIDMTDLHNLADYTRKDFIYDKDRLLAVYDEYIKLHPEKAIRADRAYKAMKNSSNFTVADVNVANKKEMKTT